ncbi:BQ5605_C013g07346 [Microbotryum silenes-dioicae]|uniref:BQ5605_C013g07346 protein n=1 Tax=Microbotryum silenes-dioicae TaxID=796604 RepID=A0A2X0ML12_9BASI|nr:BQ5605_C013g07346 [Microbotryum silenes-dioicae]
MHHQDDHEALENVHFKVKGVTTEQAQAATGTISILSTSQDKNDVVLIHTPSSDPRDPLNMPMWRKWTVAVILFLYSCAGLTVVSAAGALISFFVGDYVREGRTYNEIVQLSNFHLGTRIIIGFAAGKPQTAAFLPAVELLTDSDVFCLTGQSEALVPLMLKESFFLHERSKILAFQATFQGMIGCVLSIVSSNIASGVGWKNWYNVYAGITGVIMIASFLMVPETKFERPLEAYNGLPGTAAAPHKNSGSIGDKESQDYVEDAVPATVSNRPALDYTKHKAAPILQSLNPMPTTKVDWSEGWGIIKHMCTMILFPNVFLIIIANSWFLGVNIAQGTTVNCLHSYGTVLNAPPYNWAEKWTGLASAGQIVVSFLLLPLVGVLGDRLVTYMARRNGGVHEPEVRLMTLAFPTIIGVFCAVLLGYAFSHPYKVHWFAILFSYAGVYFAFIAASVAGLTYLLDAYPTRSGSVLTLVCGCRGLISFGMTYSLTPTTDRLGHFAAYGMYAGVMGALGIGGFCLYLFGKRLRLWTLRFVVDAADIDNKPRYG